MLATTVLFSGGFENLLMQSIENRGRKCSAERGFPDLLGGHFGYSLFFLLGGGEGGSPRHPQMWRSERKCSCFGQALRHMIQK